MNMDSTKQVRYENVDAGTVLVVISDQFDCMDKYTARTVRKDENGLYINCEEGKHYLDGQVNDDGTLSGLALEA